MTVRAVPLADVASAVSSSRRRILLAEQAALVHELAERTVAAAYDREQLRESHRRAMLACTGITPPSRSPIVGAH